jgi:putative ABC transport system permease protein
MSFLDQSFEQQFRTENMVSTLSAWFTVLAVVISCLGLFGLALFNTERRVKEIGVRKVLGATVSGLVLLLCRDFVKLILYAILIGIPVAYFVMDEYLKRYPYHTELDLWKFVLPSSIIMCLSVMIIGWQSGKAALENPVEALRTE